MLSHPVEFDAQALAKILNTDYLQKILNKQYRTRSDCILRHTVWSGSSLIAIMTTILWIPALKICNLFENRTQKVFESLKQLIFYLKFWTLFSFRSQIKYWLTG